MPESSDDQQNDAKSPDEKSARSMTQRMGLAALILSASILLSRLLGFLREAVIVYKHGASSATDAYYAAFTLPDLMGYFLAGGTLSITFIPLFSDYVANDDEEGGWRLFSTILTTMGVILVAFVIGLELLAPHVVPLLFPGFNDASQIDLTVAMTRIVIPAQLAFYVGGLLQATLFVREVFWPSAIAPLVYNICIIAGGVLLDPWLGIMGFSVGALVGAMLGPMLIPMWAARNEIKFTPHFSLTDPGFKRFILLSLPLMIGVSLVTVDEWLLRYFGSMLESGAITWLHNSRKIMLVLFAIIGQAAGQAALPYLSRLYHEGKESEMGQMMARSLQRIAFLAVIAAAGLIVASEPMIYLVFQRGEFSPADATATANLLVVFAFGLLAWTAQALAVRGFYAREDTLTPMLIGTGVVVVAAPIYWFLFKGYGAMGLAAASATGISINALATLLVYRWRKGNLPLLPIAKGLGRGLVFAVACGAAAWGVQSWLDPMLEVTVLWENTVLLAAMATAFFGAGGIVAVFFRPPELERVLARVRKKLKRT
ncbi:MAG: murein biosynthesis integral membrane protein MurJ [Myxococcota bacterium]